MVVSELLAFPLEMDSLILCVDLGHWWLVSCLPFDGGLWLNLKSLVQRPMKMAVGNKGRHRGFCAYLQNLLREHIQLEK